MKKKVSTVFLGFILSFSNAFAEVPSLKCTVESPCQYSKDLGHCLLSSFNIRQEILDNDQVGMAAVVGKQNKNIKQEIFSIAAIIPVNEKIAEGYRNIMGSADEGDNWIRLTPKNFSRLATSYHGVLTLEQDFEFQVSCQK